MLLSHNLRSTFQNVNLSQSEVLFIYVPSGQSSANVEKYTGSVMCITDASIIHSIMHF